MNWNVLILGVVFCWVFMVHALRICMFLLRYALIIWLGLVFMYALSSSNTVMSASLGVAIRCACEQSMIYFKESENMKSKAVLLS